MNVFISHAADDREFAEKLASALRARSYSVWTDRDLLPGENWAKVIDRALGEADLMVALVSPAAVQSQWVKAEWEYALANEKFAGRLIPVILDEAAGAGTPWVFERVASVKSKSVRSVADEVVRLAQTGAGW